MDRGEKPAEPPIPAGFWQFIGMSADGTGWSYFVVEKDMATGLNSFLDHLREIAGDERHFVAAPYYDQDGDSLIFYAENVQSYAKRVNTLLTVFLATDGHRLVGCEIKGVRHILSLVRRFNVAVIDKATLGMFFAFALVGQAEDETRQFEQFKDVGVDTSELVAC